MFCYFLKEFPSRSETDFLKWRNSMKLIEFLRFLGPLFPHHISWQVRPEPERSMIRPLRTCHRSDFDRSEVPFLGKSWWLMRINADECWLMAWYSHFFSGLGKLNWLIATICPLVVGGIPFAGGLQFFNCRCTWLAPKSDWIEEAQNSVQPFSMASPRRIESKTPAFATPRWKPCLGRRSTLWNWDGDGKTWEAKMPDEHPESISLLLDFWPHTLSESCKVWTVRVAFNIL